MYLVDYHTHPFGHGEKYQDYFKILQKYIKKARQMGIKEVGFSDHDNFFEDINWRKLQKLKTENEIKIKVGIEIDYIPENENEIQNMIKKVPLDYCIGSVHKIGDWEFDHPDFMDQYQKRDLDTVFKSYFNYVNQAILSGMFDIVGHFDLIKIFNYKPVNLDIMKMVEPVLKNIKKNDLVMEINTNGLNKPVGEIYPTPDIIKRAYELNIPVTLGSDAHSYQRVGENLEKAGKLLKKIGYEKIAIFDRKNIQMKKI